MLTAGLTLTATLVLVATPTAAAPDPDGSDLYANPDHWLCHPDLDDVCDSALDATIVDADARRRSTGSPLPKIHRSTASGVPDDLS